MYIYDIVFDVFLVFDVTTEIFLFIQVVTDCNDSARAMERTEQLHTIYNQLSFGKMKVH